jgi:SagB-type dehydrogenase family enzyme
VTPGFHHYNVENHRLDEICSMPSEQARQVAADLSAGQDNLASAPVLILLISRYDRLFWKYRDHKKAYKVSLMDAAHLSQTFYLVCEALGLGACFTAAIRDSVIEAHLNLDTTTQGVAGVCACGVPSEDGKDLEMHPKPYKPGSDEI